jgi:hypothetical protein
MFLAVLELGSQDDLRYLNPVWAGNLASLALAAILHPLVNGFFSVEAEALSIGA